MHPATIARFVMPCVSCAGVFLIPLASAQAPTQSFKDVPPTHPAFEAVEHWKAQGVLGGFPDGTFRPNDNVTRSQAIKIIMAPHATAEQLAIFKTTTFKDIAVGSWELPYVEAAKKTGIIDDKPEFKGANPVTKAEFLKMMLAANRFDMKLVDHVKVAVAPDVGPDQWHFGPIKAGIYTSAIVGDPSGNFMPGKALTRAETAIIMRRYFAHRDGLRTQAGMAAAETAILNTLSALEASAIDNAEYHSIQALLYAQGAASKSDIPMAKGALKTTESFRGLVRAYRAGVDQKFDEVIRLAGEAWNLAAQAKQLEPTLSNVTDQVQIIAKNMADSARAMKAGAPPAEIQQ